MPTFRSTNDGAARPAFPRHARGAILVPAMLLIVTLTMLALLLLETSAEVVTRVEHEAQDARLDATGDAAVGLAMHKLWLRYKAQGGMSASLTAFRSFLDDQAVLPQVRDPATQEAFDIFGYVAPQASAWADVLEGAGLPRNGKGQPTVDGARVHGIEVLRQDAPQVTALRVRATVSFGTDAGRHQRRDVERLYFAGGEKFRGLEFALLANNVNCIMCHARVDSAERYYNRDPGRYGTFDRVRAGTLASLKIRAGSAQSDVYGTIYTRGPVMDKDGTLLADLTSTSLDSAAFNADGKLVQNGVGGLTGTNFANTPGDPAPAGGNLYLNYPRESERQKDGPFPEEFPPVIPDANANRRVDDEEFVEWQDTARGSLAGGKKAIVPLGGTYAAAGLPVFDQVARLEGSIVGHVVLVGTAADPLVLDGRVAVSGDVVLTGVVRGSGEIIARNNVYVVGPLLYADAVSGGNRVFGVAADGTPNRVTIAAGGSILLGDFLRGKSADEGISGEPSGDFNFAMSEITLFNQMEWARAQPDIAGPAPKKSETPPPPPSGLPSNPLYDPAHRPRYYVLYETNPVAIFNKGDTYFSAATATWLGKEHLGGWDDSSTTYLPPGDPAREAATVIALMPAGAWLAATQLIAMWNVTSAAHTGGPLEIDAFLYTNNAIFLLTRKASVYQGQALINGGLVGADLGILVAGNGGVGLQLNFDRRHEDVLKLRESTKGELELSRGVRLR